jgi:hypothetical protein
MMRKSREVLVISGEGGSVEVSYSYVATTQCRGHTGNVSRRSRRCPFAISHVLNRTNLFRPSSIG